MKREFTQTMHSTRLLCSGRNILRSMDTLLSLVLVVSPAIAIYVLLVWFKWYLTKEDKD